MRPPPEHLRSGARGGDPIHWRAAQARPHQASLRRPATLAVTETKGRVRPRLVALLALILGLAPAGPAVAQNTGEAVILSTYGSRLGANKKLRVSRHAGVDFGAVAGAPVLAAAPGVVRQIINSPLGCGTGVVLAHPPFPHQTAYCHMQRALVRAGERVARGQPIGLIGTSGNAVGVPHVHFELCTAPCVSHADGDLGGTRDPLSLAAGCFSTARAYPEDRLVLTFPVECLWWTFEKYR